jgi:hypothetical protein
MEVWYIWNLKYAMCGEIDWSIYGYDPGVMVLTMNFIIYQALLASSSELKSLSSQGPGRLK